MLGFFSRKATNPGAVIAVVAGTLIIAWLTVGEGLPESIEFLRLPLHANLPVVVGTLAIFLVGVVVSRVLKRGDSDGA